MKKIKSMILLCFCLGAAPLSAAITINHTLTNESNSFTTGGPIGALSRASVSTSGLSFNFDFSALGEEVVTVTWAAPIGQMFFIEAPSTFTQSPSLLLQYSGGGSGSTTGRFVDNSPMLNLVGATGGLSVASSSVSLTGPGAPDSNAVFDFRVIFSLVGGQSYSFESLSLTTTVPASYTGVFDNVAASSTRLSGSVSNADSFDPIPADPGQWVSLASSVPEPSSVMLSLFGGLCLLLMRRRSY